MGQRKTECYIQRKDPKTQYLSKITCSKYGQNVDIQPTSYQYILQTTLQIHNPKINCQMMASIITCPTNNYVYDWYIQLPNIVHLSVNSAHTQTTQSTPFNWLSILSNISCCTLTPLTDVNERINNKFLNNYELSIDANINVNSPPRLN